jgi:hypothetical protein
MPANRRSSDRRAPQPFHHHFRISLVLLLVTIACGIFVYQVSPLRDPSFVASGTLDARSSLPWAKGFGESDWLWGTVALAGVLASHSVHLIWQRYQNNRATWNMPQRSSNPIDRILNTTMWLGLGSVIFGVIFLFFVAFLLWQWLID